MTKIVVVLMLVAATAAADTAPPDTAALRKTCTSAMNADHNFAKDVVGDALKFLPAESMTALCTDVDTMVTHQQAASRVETNERHVVLAYVAMWIVAAAFVVFLWWRQQMLRAEIAQLRKDLDAAAKDSAKP